jgi:hypothetical protein
MFPSFSVILTIPILNERKLFTGCSLLLVKMVANSKRDHQERKEARVGCFVFSLPI